MEMTESQKVMQRNKTRLGLCKKLYYAQRGSSKDRGHEMPDYEREWLVDWIQSQPHFDALFNAWVESDYDTKLRPSVDRVDESKPYTKNNIQLVTWRYNNIRRKTSVIRNTKGRFTKHVIQLDLEGWVVDTHESTAVAARRSGTSQSNISNVCNGKHKQSGGYVWRFI
tara:strand:+ start:1815 stop:2318 length:504 start_codon:yes stop_codon:yes gene_type:complete